MQSTNFSSNRRVRLLVVDGSVLVRRAFMDAYATDEFLEVASSAPDGELALLKMNQVNPDAILFDTHLPAGSLTWLEQVRQRYPDVPIILLGEDNKEASDLVQLANKIGARDYAVKPRMSAGANGVFFDEVRSKIQKLFRASGTGRAPVPDGHGSISRRLGARRIPRRIVVIGVSTGGPDALKVVLAAVPPGFPLPVVIVQHMLPTFTPYLTQQLRSHCPLPVEEAQEGMPLLPGRILIAPGDFHVKCSGTVTKPQITLDQSRPENSCRPAVDPLFRSAAETFGPACVGVILTGMGRDGLLGARALKDAGGYVIAQDEKSSVVWGMPGQVVNAGLADVVADLTNIVPEILKQI